MTSKVKSTPPKPAPPPGRKPGNPALAAALVEIFPEVPASEPEPDAANFEMWPHGFAEVHPSGFVIDPQVQRDVEKGEVREMVRNFKPSALGTFTASERANGDLVLLDGLQRRTACAEVGYDEPVDTKIYTDLTLKQEADLFLTLNFRRSVPALAMFKKEVLRGDPDAVEVAKIVAEFDLEIEPSEFSAVRAAKTIVGWPNGAQCLRWAISLSVDTWGRSKKNLHGEVIKGFAMLYARDGNAVDTEFLRHRLALLPSGIDGLMGNARTVRSVKGGHIAINVVDYTIKWHNDGRRGVSKKLAEWVR